MQGRWTRLRPSAAANRDETVDFDTVFGRGLLIMRTFMDEVRYSATGNEVTLIKRSQRFQCRQTATTRKAKQTTAPRMVMSLGFILSFRPTTSTVAPASAAVA